MLRRVLYVRVALIAALLPVGVLLVVSFFLPTEIRILALRLAVIALVGMPTQEIAGAITFWTAAAWYLRIAGPSNREAAPLRPWPTG